MIENISVEYLPEFGKKIFVFSVKSKLSSDKIVVNHSNNLEKKINIHGILFSGRIAVIHIESNRTTGFNGLDCSYFKWNDLEIKTSSPLPCINIEFKEGQAFFIGPRPDNCEIKEPS